MAAVKRCSIHTDQVVMRATFVPIEMTATIAETINKLSLTSPGTSEADTIFNDAEWTARQEVEEPAPVSVEHGALPPAIIQSSARAAGSLPESTADKGVALSDIQSPVEPQQSLQRPEDPVEAQSVPDLTTAGHDLSSPQNQGVGASGAATPPSGESTGIAHKGEGAVEHQAAPPIASGVELFDDPPPPPPGWVSPTPTSHTTTTRSGRVVERRFHKDYVMLNLSYKKSFAKYGDTADRVAMEELKQLLDKHVFNPIKYKNLTKAQRKRILPCAMFFKEKLHANGAFDRLKARLVAMGNFQLKSEYPDRSSPTVDLTSFMFALGIAVNEGLFTATADIGGAFLHSERDPNGPEEFMRLNEELTRMLVELEPEFKKFVEDDGTLIVKLDRALYGLIEAPALWHKHISATLIKFGFVQCASDKCVFFKYDGSEKTVVCLHVDDLFISATSVTLIEQLLAQLRAVYDKVTSKIGDELEYIGMELIIDRKKRTIGVKQTGYIKEILGLYRVKPEHVAATPSTLDLLDEVESDAVDELDYLSKVMKLMFLAKRSRPEILFPVSYLATKCKCPTVDLMKKLDRVIRYLNGTQDIFLTLRADNLRLQVYCDASYATHSDAKSHSGSVITIGMKGGPILTSSKKQKIVSRSSTEAELIALHDGLANVVWLRRLMEELGYDHGPSVVYQDNMSTISLAKTGPSSSGKSKHIHVRYFYVKQLIDDKQITVEHKPTELMLADILTKPLVGKLFIRLRAMLLNLTEEE